MKRELTRNEVLVMKAAKGHFSFPYSNGSEAVDKILQRIVYNHTKPIDVMEKLGFVKAIILATRDWTAQQWEDKNQFMLKKAYADRFWEGEQDQKEFLELLYRYWCTEVAMVLAYDTANSKDIINLDITREEQRKVNEAIAG